MIIRSDRLANLASRWQEYHNSHQRHADEKFCHCFSKKLHRRASYSSIAEASAAAARIATGVNSYLKNDMVSYNLFFAERYNKTASTVADAVNDTFIKVSGDASGDGADSRGGV